MLKVHGNAEVYDNVLVFGNAKVHGKDKVYGNAMYLINVSIIQLMYIKLIKPSVEIH